ncbi:MAG: protoporphyrinogen oxidase HemJ [Rickettsiales bacterium]
MEEYYLWIKSFHLIFVISWMAGLFYLPRLYVYHCQVPKGGDQDKLFQIMEKRLLKFIMNPAMIISVVLGFLLAKMYGFKNLGTWFHIKMTLALVLIYFHHFLGRRRKDFEKGLNTYSSNFYKIINEIPTVLMIIMVILVIVKPFQ